MLANLVLGTALISGTVLIHTLGLIVVSRSVVNLIDRFRLHRHDVGRTVAMIATVLSIFLVHTIEVWVWALLYILLGALDRLNDAVYFSAATFSTLGYGDVTLPMPWRVLGSLEGINGFLLIGWSTAYLVGASTRYGPFRTEEHF